MAKLVSPTPFKAPMVDASSMISPAWAAWFRDLFDRIGGLSASSNVELATSLTSTQATVTLHGTRITTLETTVSTLSSTNNDLNQGPTL